VLGHSLDKDWSGSSQIFIEECLCREIVHGFILINVLNIFKNWLLSILNEFLIMVPDILWHEVLAQVFVVQPVSECARWTILSSGAVLIPHESSTSDEDEYAVDPEEHCLSHVVS